MTHQADETIQKLLNKITQQVAILAHQVDMLQIHNSIGLIRLSLLKLPSKTVPINISPIPNSDPYSPHSEPANSQLLQPKLYMGDSDQNVEKSQIPNDDPETISQPPNSDSPILPALKLLSDRPLAALDDSRHMVKKSEDTDFIQRSCFSQLINSMITNGTFESTIPIYNVDSTMLGTYEHEVFALLLDRNGKNFFEKVVFIFDSGGRTINAGNVSEVWLTNGDPHLDDDEFEKKFTIGVKDNGCVDEAFDEMHYWHWNVWSGTVIVIIFWVVQDERSDAAQTCTIVLKEANSAQAQNFISSYLCHNLTSTTPMLPSLAHDLEDKVDFVGHGNDTDTAAHTNATRFMV